MAGLKIIKKGDRLIKEYVDNKTGKIAKYEPGLRLEVSDFKGTWYPAKVLEVDHEENEVLVHYDKWSARYDEWIATDSNRLRPSSQTNVVQIQYKVGERVEALWSTDGLRYPGTIKAIHPNDYYEVLFDDGIKCKKKGSQIYKIQRITRGKAAQVQDQKYRRTSSPRLPPNNQMQPPVVGPDAVSNSLKLSNKAKAGLEGGTLRVEGVNGDHKNELSLSSKLAEDATVLDSRISPATSITSSPSTPKGLSSPLVEGGELGKRKRAYHDYSLFLKIPKKTQKTGTDGGTPTERRRASSSVKDNDLVVREEVLVHETLAPPLEDDHSGSLPAKRSRKISLRAVESFANATMLPPKGRPGRKPNAARVSIGGSPLESSPGELKVNGTSELSTVPNGALESKFIDEQGNIVTIEQNSDGGWICPLQACGKTFRKDSLLQMHLQHYHPGSNIKFKGKKLNVFEMAMAKAQIRTDSTYEVREKDHPEVSSGETVSAAQKRRKSMPVSITHSPVATSGQNGVSHLESPSLPESRSDTFEVKHDGFSERNDKTVTREGRKSFADEKGNDHISENGTKLGMKKLNSSVTVVLEKINGSQTNCSTTASSRVSKRGRPLLSRSWNKERLVEEEMPSSDEELKTEISPPSKRLKFSRGRRFQSMGHVTAKEKSANLIDPSLAEVHRDVGIVAANVSTEEAIQTEGDKPLSACGRRLKNMRTQQHGRPQHSRQQHLIMNQRRRHKIFEQSAIEHIKARKLEVITDELLKVGNQKKIAIKPRFEDVRVDIINCVCAMQEEFGLMMQCELCQAWQHGNCYGVEEVTQLPPYYVCSYCRMPSNIRKSRKYEWYQEINTTGRLPRFTFCPNPEPEDEEKMQGCNDLLNSLSSLQNMLRCTQVKISMLDAPASSSSNPNLEDPLEEARQNDFRSNFRPVLRHLLRCNRHDKGYIPKLRSQVAEILSQNKEKSLDKKVESRLHSRALSLLKQKLGRKLLSYQSNPLVDTDLEVGHSAFASCIDGDSPKVFDDSAAPTTSNTVCLQDTISRLREQLEVKLSDPSLLVDSIEDNKKFLLLTIDSDTVETDMKDATQKVIVLANDEDNVIGVGQAMIGVNEFQIVKVLPPQNERISTKCTDPSCSGNSNVVPAGKVSNLSLCKACQDAVQVTWSKKHFVDQEGIQISCMNQTGESSPPEIKLEVPEQNLSPSSTSIASHAAPDSRNISLKSLCEQKIREFNLSNTSNVTTLKDSEDKKEEEAEPSTTEECENPVVVNLRARIIREQALLDEYLDAIDDKLKELENGQSTDPQQLIAKLKDLEDLKLKVEKINENMELLRDRIPKSTAVSVDQPVPPCS